jgi:hypothetical protein
MRRYTRVGLVFATSILGAPLSLAAQGLTYYIGQDIAIVTGTTSVTTTRTIEELTGISRDKCETRHGAQNAPTAKSASTAQSAATIPVPVERELCVTSTPKTTRTGTAALQLVPDPTLAVVISPSSPGLIDQQQSVQLTDGLLLKSINVQNTGRAGDVITSIAKFAGTIGGLSFLAAKALPAPPVAVSTCDPFDGSHKDLPDPVRLMLWENQDRCDKWTAIKRLDSSHDARVKDRT